MDTETSGVPLWMNRIIKFSFALLFILVPLILTPWNYELFEYNKMMVVYALTAIIAAAWLVKMIHTKEIRIAKTPLDIPIALFLISQLVSSLFSMDPHVSWFGYYSRFNGGMWSVISYVLLYYAFISNNDSFAFPSARSIESEIMNHELRKNQKNSTFPFIIHNSIFIILRIALATGAAVALYGVAERLGIDKHLWVQDVQNRVFSTLGQPNWLAAYLVALIPIAMGFALKSQIPNMKSETNLKSQAPNSKQDILHFGHWNFDIVWSLEFVIWCFISVLFFAVLLFTRSRSGLFGFFIADLVFWALLFLLRFNLFEAAKKVKPFEAKLFLPLVICHLSFAIIIFFNGTYIDSIDRWATFNAWQHRITNSGNPTDSQNLKEATASAASYAAPLLETGGTESGTIRKYVWQGAIAAWKSSTKTFLIGTGTETFAFAFFQFRPVGHNMTSEWDFLYNKAHNEYLNYLATTGILGLGSYLLFIGFFIYWFIKVQSSKFKVQINAKAHPSKQNLDFELDLSFDIWILQLALFSAWLSILVTNFFGFSVVIVQLFFFLFPAMMVISNQPSAISHQQWKTLSVNITRQVSKWTSVTLLLAFLALLGLLAKMWYADTLFASGYRLARAGQYAQAQPLIRDAIALNGGEPLYHDEYSTTLAALTTMAVDQQQATLAATLAKQALTESDTAIGISPKNVNFWKSRTKIFYSFAAFDPQFNPASIQALTRAWELSPNDPKIIYNLAILYGRQNDNAKAIELLQKAIAMKPNYRDAYFALNIFYQETRQTQKARDILSEYLQKVDPKDQDFLERIK